MLRLKYEVNEGRCMMDLVEDLKKYLDESLGIQISIFPWKDQKKLPFFLVDAYTIFESSLLGNPCLIMISKNDVELTPHTIQKHWKQVAKKWSDPCIYISHTISSYTRNRLIQHRIPFIIPNNQIYIPDFGLDLREHFKQQRIHKEIFSPATQTVIISTLLREKSKSLIPSELAITLGYSPMTMTRVFNELETAGIGKLIKKGKERQWLFEGTRKNLWEQTNEMLRSPIRSLEPMKLWPGGKIEHIPLAGLSALAEMTMINSPSLPVYAIGVEEYRQTTIPKGFQLTHIDEADFELEIWNYNPILFSKNEKVDPFSLYLSLRETTDERIETALEELMEKIQW
jgi:DNA-binding transcriptional regulator YhcF (GntR family)